MSTGTRSPAPAPDSNISGSLSRLPPLLPERGLHNIATTLLPPALLFIASRAVVIAALLLASAVTPDLPVRETFRKWDGGYYLAIAEHGYPDHVPESPDGVAHQSVVAFFPLYPALAAGVHVSTGLGLLEAALLVSALAGLAAALLLWLLVRALSGTDCANRATALFCFFPGGVVWSLVYAEPLMVALSLGCLVALLRRRWLAAGVLSGVATAARPNALVLVACCAFAAFTAVRERQEWRSLLAPLLAPIGFFAFIAYLATRTGEWGAWWRVQREAWPEHFALSGETFARLSKVAHHHPWGNRSDINALIATGGLLVAVALVWCMALRRPPPVLWIFAIGVALISLTLTSTSLGLRPRFVHTAFPMIVAGACTIRGRWIVPTLALSAGCAFGLAYLTVATLHAVP